MHPWIGKPYGFNLSSIHRCTNNSLAQDSDSFSYEDGLPVLILILLGPLVEGYFEQLNEEPVLHVLIAVAHGSVTQIPASSIYLLYDALSYTISIDNISSPLQTIFLRRRKQYSFSLFNKVLLDILVPWYFSNNFKIILYE